MEDTRPPAPVNDRQREPAAHAPPANDASKLMARALAIRGFRSAVRPEGDRWFAYAYTLCPGLASVSATGTSPSEAMLRLADRLGVRIDPDELMGDPLHERPKA